MNVFKQVKSIFKTQGKASQQHKQPHIYANEILKTFAFVKDILESKFRANTDLVGQIEAITDGYKNRVETKVDVSALDELSTETLKYLEKLIVDETIYDQDKVLNIIKFALEVLGKIYHIQAQCEEMPDVTLITGLRCGCKAVKVKYDVLIHSTELIKQENRFKQIKAEILARQKELVEQSIDPTEDHIMVMLVEERKTLDTSIGQLNRICILEVGSIPQLESGFTSVNLVNLDEDIIKTTEDAMELLVENEKILERMTVDNNALMMKRRAIRDEIDKFLRQKTETQRSVQDTLKVLGGETPTITEEIKDLADTVNENPLEMEDNY